MVAANRFAFCFPVSGSGSSLCLTLLVVSFQVSTQASSGNAAGPTTHIRALLSSEVSVGGACFRPGRKHQRRQIEILTVPVFAAHARDHIRLRSHNTGSFD